MIPRIDAILLLGFFILYSCTTTSTKENQTETEPEKEQVEVLQEKKGQIQKSIEKSVEIKDDVEYWQCHAFQKDDRYTSDYGEAYAQEFSKYSTFKIKNDQLIFDDCAEDFYTYSYATKLKRYDDESLYITYFKPKQDSVVFLTTLNTSVQNKCIPLDISTFYQSGSGEWVVHDRAYFFFYKKAKAPLPMTKGTPGNNRTPWEVDITIPKVKTIEEGYAYFLKNYPYGGDLLLRTLPKEEIYKDLKNAVVYTHLKDRIEIQKSDKMGIIHMEIWKKEDQEIRLIYRMEYPDAG